MQSTIYERRDERFGLVLNSQEKAALLALAEHERITAAAVLRRLLWQAAKDAHIYPTYQETSHATHTP